MQPTSNATAWLNFAQLPREQGGLGLQTHQAAGLVGNLVRESGPDLNPWGPTGDNGTAMGTAQWRNERLQGLKDFAASKGLDFRTMEAQQGFMRHEMDGPENRAYQALTSASTPEAAASVFNKLYERSADQSGRREQSARELMMQFGGTSPTGSAMAFASNGSPSNGGGISMTPEPDDGFLGQLGVPAGMASRLGRAGAAMMALDNPSGAAAINNGLTQEQLMGIRRAMMAQKVQAQAPVGSDWKYDDKSGSFYRTTVTGDLETKKNPNVVEAAQVNPNTVKAIIEGRAPYPANSRATDAAAIREAVNDADPTFDAVNYNSRLKTRQDFTSGKSAQNLSSFNTSINHIGELEKAIDGLNNGGWSPINAVSNAIASRTDPKFDTALKEFNTAKTAVASELTRAFRGTGGNVHDLIEWEKSLDAASSPEALHGAVREAAKLLQGRIDAVGDQYNRGMGSTKDPMELLTPEAAKSFRRIMEGGGAGNANPVEAEMRRRGLLK